MFDQVVASLNKNDIRFFSRKNDRRDKPSFSRNKKISKLEGAFFIYPEEPIKDIARMLKFEEEIQRGVVNRDFPRSYFTESYQSPEYWHFGFAFIVKPWLGVLGKSTRAVVINDIFYCPRADIAEMAANNVLYNNCISLEELDIYNNPQRYINFE